MCSTRRDAHCVRVAAANYLRDLLGLSLNPKNNVVVPAGSGLHFLGHVVTSSYAVVDRRTSKAALQKVTVRNLASYQSLLLAKDIKKQLNWNIVDEITEILLDK